MVQRLTGQNHGSRAWDTHTKCVAMESAARKAAKKNGQTLLNQYKLNLLLTW
jgi:hypothetical protein